MDIYVIGDIEFIANALNAVAIMMNSGSIGGMVILGALIGVLLVTINTLISQRLDLHHLLIGWMVIVGFLVPRTDVVLESYRTGELLPVADVPLGIAATASFVSTVGYNLTELFETSLATPSMADTGFVDPLKVLLGLREAGLGFAASTLNTGNSNVDLNKTITQYIADCTLYAVDLGYKTEQDLLNAVDVREAIRVESDIWGTQTWLNPAQPGIFQTCTQAHDAIRAATDFANAAFWVPWTAHINSALDLDPVLNSINEVDDAIAELNAVAFNAQNFMLNVLMWDLLNEGTQLKYAQDGNVAASAVVASAREARNIEMAAEGSMFKRFVVPIASFLEVFVFVMTPFIAFFAVLGIWGLMRVVGFFALLVWVQLWPPIMAIVNSYTIWIVQRANEAREAANLPFGSIANMETIYPMMSDWLGTSGMMMASVASLALMIIYGGSHAAVNMASRIAARDTVDESTVAPGVLRNSSPLSASSHFTGTPTSGATVTGSPEMLQFSIGEALQSTQTSSTTNSSGYTQQQTADAMRSIGEAYSINSSSTSSAKVAETVRNQDSHMHSAARSAVTVLQSSAGATTAEQDAMSASVAMTWSAGGMAGDFSGMTKQQAMVAVKGNLFTRAMSAIAPDDVSATGRSTETDTKQRLSQMATEMAERIVNNDSVENSLMKGYGKDLVVGNDNIARSDETARQEESLRSQWVQNKQHSETSAQEARSSQAFNTSTNMNGAQFGLSAVRYAQESGQTLWSQAMERLDEGAKAELQDIDRGLASNHGGAFKSMIVNPGETAQQSRANAVNARRELAAAMFMQRSEARGHDGDGAAVDPVLKDSFVNMLSSVGAADMSGGNFDATRNSDLTDPTVSVKEKTGLVASATDFESPRSFDDLRTEVESQHAGAQQKVDRADSEIDRRSREGGDTVRGYSGEQLEKLIGNGSPVFDLALNHSRPLGNAVEVVGSVTGGVRDGLNAGRDLFNGFENLYSRVTSGELGTGDLPDDRSLKEELGRHYEYAASNGAGHFGAIYYAYTQAFDADEVNRLVDSSGNSALQEYVNTPEAEYIAERGDDAIQFVSSNNVAFRNREHNQTADDRDGVTGVNYFTGERLSGWDFEIPTEQSSDPNVLGQDVRDKLNDPRIVDSIRDQGAVDPSSLSLQVPDTGNTSADTASNLEHQGPPNTPAIDVTERSNTTRSSETETGVGSTQLTSDKAK